MDLGLKLLGSLTISVVTLAGLEGLNGGIEERSTSEKLLVEPILYFASLSLFYQLLELPL
jgi:hypothetical protein